MRLMVLEMIEPTVKLAKNQEFVLQTSTQTLTGLQQKVEELEYVI